MDKKEKLQILDLNGLDLNELAKEVEKAINLQLLEGYKNIALPFGGFEIWVKKPENGEKIDLSYLLKQSQINDSDMVVDYNFGAAQKQGLSPYVIFDYLTAKHGSSKKAMEVLNELINQKPN
jgi:hypothetical protein